MATKIILTADETLSMEEVSDLRYIFADALGEFAARRTPAHSYVDSRYPGKDFDPTREEKITQVDRRILLARKLHNATLTYKTFHDAPGGLSADTLAEMAESGERAGACILFLQDVFEMKPVEARDTYNQLEDIRVAKQARLVKS